MFFGVFTVKFLKIFHLAISFAPALFFWSLKKRPIQGTAGS